MLKLRDFSHLPELDPLVQEMLSGEPGLVIVAGLDPRFLPPASPLKGPAADIFLPSGRTAIFDILLHEIMSYHPAGQAAVVTRGKSLARTQRQYKHRTHLYQVNENSQYVKQIHRALETRPDLLVIDRIEANTAGAVLDAASRGLHVLAQIDTVLRGAEVIKQLLDWGINSEQLEALRWVFAVQRVATLCSSCRQPATPSADELYKLGQSYPQLVRIVCDLNPDGMQLKPGISFFQMGSCKNCHGTGRSGDISAFDVFQAQGNRIDQTSRLSLEEYMLRQVCAGKIPLEDLFRLEKDQLRRTYNLLTASEQALTDSNAELNRRLAELESAHRVLQQRTEVMVNLQDLSNLLISTTNLKDLADRVCRKTAVLCGADLIILYHRGVSPAGREQAQVLATLGWNPVFVTAPPDTDQVFNPHLAKIPTPYPGWPPGVLPYPMKANNEDQELALRAGLRVPLIAHDQQVGLMIVHSTQKSSFTQGQIALLQTLANQAALAIQRTSLIEQLREKIEQLEAAQGELVTKERLERELELARQVQQSMLPSAFPDVPGVIFAARNRPARQVGGDFYDVLELDENHIGLVIGDVSDKGLPAALFMALTRSLIVAEAERSHSPREVLSNVNRLLQKLGEPAMFVTIFYGVLEYSQGLLRYCRAGHERPALLRENNLLSLEGDGTLLGVLDEKELQLGENEITLQTGDRLVLYTDGMSDVMDAEGQFYLQPNLERLLQQHAGLPADEMCEAVFKTLDSYRAGIEQFDDMTMLVLDIN